MIVVADASPLRYLLLIEHTHVPVLGTLRVLADASEHGFADLAVAFAGLRQTNFRATEQLLDQLLRQVSRGSDT